MSFATLVLIDEETSNNLVLYVANALGDEAAAFTGMVAAHRVLECFTADMLYIGMDMWLDEVNSLACLSAVSSL